MEGLEGEGGPCGSGHSAPPAAPAAPPPVTPTETAERAARGRGRPGGHLLRIQVSSEVCKTAIEVLGSDTEAAALAVLGLRQPDLRHTFAAVFRVHTSSGNNGWMRGKLLQALGLNAHWRPEGAQPPPSREPSAEAGKPLRRRLRRRTQRMPAALQDSSSDESELSCSPEPAARRKRPAGRPRAPGQPGSPQHAWQRFPVAGSPGPFTGQQQQWQWQEQQGWQPLAGSPAGAPPPSPFGRAACSPGQLWPLQVRTHVALPQGQQPASHPGFAGSAPQGQRLLPRHGGGGGEAQQAAALHALGRRPQHAACHHVAHASPAAAEHPHPPVDPYMQHGELSGQLSSTHQHMAAVAALHSLDVKPEPVTTGALLPPPLHPPQPCSPARVAFPCPQPPVQQPFGFYAQLAQPSSPAAWPASMQLAQPPSPATSQPPSPAAWPASMGGPFTPAMPHPPVGLPSAGAAPAPVPMLGASLPTPFPAHQWSPAPFRPPCAAAVAPPAADVSNPPPPSCSSPFAAVAALPLPDAAPCAPPARPPLPLSAHSFSLLLAEFDGDGWDDGGADLPFAGWQQGTATSRSSTARFPLA